VTALTEAFVSVRPDMDKFEPELKGKLGRIDTSKEGAKAGAKFGSGFSSKVSSVAKGTAGILAGAFATLGAGKFLKDAIGSASDLGETTSKVAQIFGPAAKDIQAFASTATTALGQTQQAALDANSTFGLFGKSAGLKGKSLTGFTTKLTTLASDLASFNNTSPEQAIEAIGAALRGESEPIRSYGVLLDDASLKAEAMSLGLVKNSKDVDKVKAAQLRSLLASKKYNEAVKEHGKNSKEALAAEAALATASGSLKKATTGTVPALTQQQKILAAQSAIFKQTTAAQGDFARTSGGLANQQRIAAAQTSKLKVAIGNALLPVVVAATTALNTKLLPPLIDLAEKHGPELAKTLTKVTTQAGPFISNFLDKAGPALAGLRDGSSSASPALSSLADSGAKLGPIIKDLADKVPSLTDVLSVGATVIGYFANHADELAKLMPVLVVAFTAYKLAQAAGNAAEILSLPIKIANIVANKQLAASNRALVAARLESAAASGVSTTATLEETSAKNVGIFASIRMRAVQLAQAAGTVIASVATKVATVGMYALGAAVRFATGPVGLIIIGIGLLVAGLIYAYKHSETFRDIVNGVFNAVKNVASGVFTAVIGFVKGAIDWIKANWPLLLAILTGPFGLAVYAIAKNWDSIKSAASSALRYVVNKVLDFAQDILDGAAKAFGWVPGIGDKLKGAQTAFAKFRDDVNNKLGGINDQTVNVTADLKSWGTPELLAAAHGRADGGPGGPVRGPGSSTSDTAGLYALSNKEWVIKASSSQKYGDSTMKSVNDGTAMIIPGFARGGRPGLNVLAHPPSAREDSNAAGNVSTAVRAIGREMAPVMSKIMAKALGINPALNKVLDFVRSQVGKPYVWGAAGPGGYDCSGLVSAALNVAQGRATHSRRGATGSMPWPGFASGPGAFEIGWFQGNPGHTAATVNRVNIESAGGVGVRMGPGARGARNSLFTNHAHVKGFARGGRANGGDLPFDLLDPRGKNFVGKGVLRQLGVDDFDRGGPWRSGTLGVNLSGRTEHVVPGDGTMTVRFSDEDRRLLQAAGDRPITLDGRRIDERLSRRALGGGY
jgi:hypothetical protein